jgi:hypothetical protein
LWDVVYAVDASSSMAEAHRSATGQSFVKIDAVRSALSDLVSGLSFPPSCRLGVLAFRAPTKALGLLVESQRFTAVLPLTTAGELRATGSLRARLASIETGGGTPTGLAIIKALHMLASSDDGPLKRVKKLILVTDERSNVGPRPQEAVGSNVASVAMIDVVAIGGRTNKEALEELCAATGGGFFEVDNEVELRDALRPRIGDFDLGEDLALVEEAKRLSSVLTGPERSPEALTVSDSLLSRLQSRLQSVRVLLRSARGELAIRVSQTLASTGGSPPMKDYEEAVRGPLTELGTLELLEEELVNAIKSLQRS